MKKLFTFFALSLVMLFSLSARAQCDPPANLVASYNNNVSTFSWDAVNNATAYKVQLKFLGQNWGSTELTFTNPSFPLTGLMQGANFEWRVRAQCGSGFSAYTASQYTTPCPQPTGLNTSNITTGTATLNWVAPPGYNTNISAFLVAYRLANTTTVWIQLGQTFATSINVTGLIPATAYEWRVYLGCASYNSNPVMAQFTTSAASNCNAPATTTVVQTGNTSAVLSWSAVTGVSAYDLRFKTINATGWNAVTPAPGTSHTLSNLSVNTSYQYQVRSKCGTVYSAWTPVNTFTTLNCVSFGANGSEWIDLFRLGTINRSSGAETGGYNNTGLGTDLVIGSSNQARISAGFTGAVRTQNYAVYIDFNRNGNYDDAGERVFGAGYIASAGTCNFNAVIPATAIAGPAGMRVVIRKTSDGPVSACLTGFLGETEDYTVNLVSNSQRGSGEGFFTGTSEKYEPVSTISPNPSAGIFTISLPGNNAPVFYEVINNNGSIVQKQTVSKNLFTVDITGMPNGLYLLRITTLPGVQQIHKLVKN